AHLRALHSSPTRRSSDLDRAADMPLQPAGADACLQHHEPLAALFAHFFGYGIGQLVRGRAFHRRIGEATDAVELRLLEKVEQVRSEEHTSELQSRENLVC